MELQICNACSIHTFFVKVLVYAVDVYMRYEICVKLFVAEK